MVAEAAPTVEAALRTARAKGVDRLDAQLLMAHTLGRPRSWVMAHGEHVLTPDESASFGAQLQRRADGVPLSYLVGQREFHGLNLRVTPAVLDPRPDTETLVEWALERLGPSHQVVVDLGTGSGAIALAVKAARPACEVHATDASEAALAVARGNAQALGLTVLFHAGSWWHAVPRDLRVDLALSNPPYIRDDDPHLGALVHEPRSALVSGPDGLADLRRLIGGAPAHLKPGGWLMLEHGHDQGEAVGALLRERGFVEVEHRRDLAGHTRCTGGRLAR